MVLRLIGGVVLDRFGQRLAHRELAVGTLLSTIFAIVPSSSNPTPTEKFWEKGLQILAGE